MIILKKLQNIVLAQKPGDKKWKPGDREITIETGSLPAKPGELTGMLNIHYSDTLRENLSNYQLPSK